MATRQTVASGGSILVGTESITSSRVMQLRNFCLVPDPAIDAAIGTRQLPFLPLVTEIHAGLTTVNDDDPSKPEPELAETWSVGDDGATYVFRLRERLRFSDGDDLTAADVKWSWERALRKSRAWSEARSVFGDIQGADEFMKGSAAELDGLKVVDDRTLEVSLDEPVGLFPMLISGPVASVLKRSNVENWPVWWLNDDVVAGQPPPIDPDRSDKFMYADFGIDDLPVGAGPFKLNHYRVFEVDTRCSIVRNDHYWRQQTDLDAVVFDLTTDIDFTVDTDPIDPGRLFRRSQVDVSWAPTEPGLQDKFDQLLDETGARAYNAASPPYTFFVVLNDRLPPLDDVRTRQMLSAAAESDEIFEVPVRWPRVLVPHRLTGQPTDTPSAGPMAFKDQSRLDHDLTAPPITVYAGFDTFQRDRLERMFGLWNARLGFQFKLVVVDDPDELRAIRDDVGEPALRWFELEPLYPDPYAVLRVLDGAFGHRTGAPEVVGRLNELKGEPDPRKRAVLANETEQFVLDNALAIPMLVDWTDFEILVQPWVRGFNFKKFGGSVFRDVWFEDTAPNRMLP